MPAQAGIQVALYQIFWIPAFAGMTDGIAENSPTAQLISFNPLNIMILYLIQETIFSIVWTVPAEYQRFYVAKENDG